MFGRFHRRRRYTPAVLIPIALVTLSLDIFSDDANDQGIRRSPSASAQIEHKVHLPFTVRDTRIESSTPWTPSADIVLGGAAQTVDVVDDIAYIGIGTQLITMRVDHSGALEHIGASPPMPGSVADVKVEDGLAYVAVDQHAPTTERGGLFILDVSRPISPTVIGRSLIEGGAVLVEVNAPTVYVVARKSDWEGDWTQVNGILRFDVSDPFRPALRARNEDISTSVRSIALINDRVLACMPRISAFDPETLMPMPLDIELYGDRSISSCQVVVALPDEYIGVASTARNDTWFHIMDVADPAVAHEVELTPITEAHGWPGDHSVHTVMISSASYSNGLLALTGTADERTGFSAVVDVSNPRRAYDIEIEPMQSAGLDVAITSAGLITVGGDAAGGELRDFESSYAGYMREGLAFMLGSTIDSFRLVEGSEGMDIEPADRRRGSGTVLLQLAARADRAYAFEEDALGRGGGRLWALDLAGSPPEWVWSVPIEQAHNFEDALAVVGPNLVATDSAVVLLARSRMSIFDTRGGAPTGPASEIPFDEGALISRGDILYAADKGGLLTLDVSDPAAPRELSHIALDDSRWAATSVLALGEDLLWEGQDGPTLTALSLEDPARPRIIGSQEFESGEFGHGVVGIVASGSKAVLLLNGPNSVVVMQVDEETSSPEILGTLELPRTWSSVSGDLHLVDGDVVFGYSEGIDSNGRIAKIDISDPEAPRIVDSISVPTAVEARVRYDDLTAHELQIESAGERLIGTYFMGGLFSLTR